MKPRIDRYVMHGDINEHTSRQFAEFYNECIVGRISVCTLEINTNGGDCGAMNSIISYIERPDITWHGFVNGYAYSAGICILRACDVAYASETADLMFHDDVYSEVNGTLDSIRAEMSHMRKRSDREIKRFATRTKKDAKWWKASAYMQANQEHLMSPKDAKKLGVIDHIGQPVLRVRTRHEVEVEVV